VKTLLVLACLIPTFAHADYDQAEKSVERYYYSGQAQRDQVAKAEAQRNKETPQFNKNMVAAVMYFATSPLTHAKITSPLTPTYDATGRLSKLEFSLSNGEDCEALDPAIIHCANAAEHTSRSCEGIPKIEKSAKEIECIPYQFGG
jgi:hypothetical protein